MRLLDVKNSKSLGEANLELTMEEAFELVSALEAILEEPPGADNHQQIYSSDYQQEISVAAYIPGVKGTFSEKSWKAISEE